MITAAELQVRRVPKARGRVVMPLGPFEPDEPIPEIEDLWMDKYLRWRPRFVLWMRRYNPESKCA